MSQLSEETQKLMKLVVEAFDVNDWKTDLDFERMAMKWFRMLQSELDHNNSKIAENIVKELIPKDDSHKGMYLHANNNIISYLKSHILLKPLYDAYKAEWKKVDEAIDIDKIKSPYNTKNMECMLECISSLQARITHLELHFDSKH